ncbi:hypothetical protein ACSSV4_000598 [Roseovarius sp. MBR-154]|jgi:hypothetical protein
MIGIEDPGDHDLFTDPEVFGDLAQYTPQGGALIEVPGIFTAAHARVLDGAGPGVSSVSPVFAIFEDALPESPAQGDTLDLRGQSWRVADLEPDGTGMVRLILERL